MALLALLLVAAAALCCEARVIIDSKPLAPTLIGGATSYKGLADALLPKGKPCAKFMTGTYDSVGSGAGITGLFAGTYVIAMSDNPLDASVFAANGGLTGAITTLPLVLAKYGFFVNKAKGADGAVKMTAKTSFNAFKTGAGGYQPWSRSEKSGTTYIFKRYWFKALKLAELGSIQNGNPLPTSWVGGKNSLPGTSDLCNKIAVTPTGITYGQVGICNKNNPGTTSEVAVENAAKFYVLASVASSAQAIPRSPPTATKDWSAIPSKMILNTGKNTVPIASFIYAIVKTKSATGFGSKAKSLLTCLNSKTNAVANALFFDPLPASLVKQNNVYIKKLT